MRAPAFRKRLMSRSTPVAPRCLRTRCIRLIAPRFVLDFFS